MIISTHQPNYIPWLGYFYKIWKSDIFVFLDDVQFSKKGLHNFHYLKQNKASVKINIPVKHAYTDPIKNVKTNDQGGWKDRHLSLIEQCYVKATFFDIIFNDFKSILMPNYDNLADLNIAIIKFISGKFNFQTRFITSSSLEIEAKNEERIIQICKKLNATIYYSGNGAKAYQSNENFERNGLSLVYDDFYPLPYNQLEGDFIANVSIIDFLMNYGYDWNYITDKYSLK